MTENEWPDNDPCPDCETYERYRDRIWEVFHAKKQGAEVFVTVCEKLLKLRVHAEKAFNIKIQSPSEVVKDIDA